MALTSALYTGLSGLAANSERLNVVGNNIANANTVSFKSSRTLFTPQFYLTDSGGTAPTSTTGGTNPNQSGLGVQVSAIEKDFTPGAIQATGKSTDLAVDGAGFFVLQGNNQQFTRDGAFNLDSGNNLVATSGDFVQGYGVDANFKVIPGKLQNVKIPLGAASTAESTKAITLQGNFDTAGQIAAGASILNSQLLTRVGGGAAPTSATLLTDVADASSPGTALFSIGQVFTLQGSKGGSNTPPQLFKVTSSSTLNDFATVFNGGLGINTTVPADPAEPTPGTTFETDATNPNAIRIVVAGNPGTANKLALGASSFTAGAASPLTFIDGANAAGFKSNPSGESINTSAVVYDSLGNPVTIDLTAVYQSASSNGTQWTFYATSPDNKAASGSLVIGSGTLNFDTNGKLLSASTPTLTIDRSGTGAKSPFSINADFSGITALAANNSSLVVSKQDGSPLGSLSSFNIGTDGTITGSFSNGLTRTLGQIAIATFNNNEGLDDKGSNLFRASANSGTPIIGPPKNQGAGAVRGGALEQSNVDLSTEFVNMIVASTGFNASSRVITTSNQLLQDLLTTAR